MGQTDFFSLALKVDKENAEAKKKGGAQKHPTTKLDMAHPHDIVAYQKLKDGGATAAAAAGSGTGTVPVPIDVDEVVGAATPQGQKRKTPEEPSHAAARPPRDNTSRREPRATGLSALAETAARDGFKSRLAAMSPEERLQALWETSEQVYFNSSEFSQVLLTRVLL